VTGLEVTTAVTCPTVRIHPAIIAQAAAPSALMCRGGTHDTVEDARLYTRPADPVPILVSAFGPKALSLAARVGDGFVTTQPDPDALESYRSQGGRGPSSAGAKVCYGPSREDSIKTVHRLWANAGVPGELAQVLPSPKHFEQVAELVGPEMLSESMACGPDLDEHVAKLREYVDAGYDELYVSQIGELSQDFFDVYAAEVLPALREVGS